MTYGNAEFVPVILGTNINTYNMARSLHEAFGVRTIALGRAALRETASSSIVDVRADARLGDPEVVVATLLELASELRADGRTLLLLPNIEFYANVVLDHREVLEEHYVVPLVRKELADRLMHKARFAELCAELGIPHPATEIVPPGPVAEDLGDDLPFPFPVIVKPANTDIYPRLRFPGKQKVYLVADAAGLRDVVRRMVDGGYDDDIVVQEYLAGDESVMQVVNTYSDRHGRMRFSSLGQIVLGEPDPGLVGNYNAIVTTHDDEVTAMVRTLLDSVGYTGPANLDIMIDARTGARTILEVNLRQGAASFYTMAAGGNLTRCYVDDLVRGEDLPDVVTHDERLWLNVPYLVALRYAPRSLRPLLRAARRHGVTHTLRYRADRSPRRLLELARIDLRRTLDFVRHGRERLNR